MTLQQATSKQSRFRVLIFVLIVVSISLLVSVFWNQRSEKSEDPRLQETINIDHTTTLHDADLLGWSWKKGSRDLREVIYKFGPDGDLLETITEAGTSRAPTLKWEIRDGTLIISDYANHPMFVYRLLMFDGKNVYVRDPAGETVHFVRKRE